MMKSNVILVFGLASVSALGLHAETLTWAHATADMGAASSYVEGRLPQSGDDIYIPGGVETPVNPYLSDDLTVRSVFFGDSAKSTVLSCDGYTITGAAGKKLTLTSSGDLVCALNGFGTGSVTFEVPVEFSGNKPYFSGKGVHYVFSGPVSTSGEYTQHVVCDIGCTTSNDKSSCGSITLAAEGPRFKPLKLELKNASELRVANLHAISEVTEIVSGHWVSAPHTYFVNACGEPLVLDKLVSIGSNGNGHNGFHFAGDPFVMTNCEFSLSMRQSIDRYADAAVMFRRIVAQDCSGQSFAKSGKDAWICLEPVAEAEGIVNHLNVADGLYYHPGGYSAERYLHIGSGASGLITPVLGLDADTAFTMGYEVGSVWFGSERGEGKNGGFASMAGDIRVKLVEADGSMPTLTNNWKRAEDTNHCVVPEEWVFGHAASTGTVLLENNLVFRDYKGFYAFQSKNRVPAVRLLGSVEVVGSGNRRLTTHGDGACAFEGPLAASSVVVGTDNAGGGVFMNSDAGTQQFEVNGAGSYIGGTGTVRKVFFNGAGAAFRGGEFGKGMLTVDSSSNAVTLKSGCGFIVDVAADGRVGCVKLTGSNELKAEGGNFIRVTADPNLMGNGRGKILDWSEATGSVSMGDIGKYTVEVEEGCGLQGATVYAGNDGKSLWVAYRKPRPGFIIVIK